MRSAFVVALRGYLGPLWRLLEGGELEGASVEDVVLGDLDLLELEGPDGFLEEDHAGDDGGGAVGVQADDLAAADFVHVSQPGEEQFDGAELEGVAVDEGWVVGVELEVDGGGGGGGAGDGDGVFDEGDLVGWEAIEERGVDVEGEGLELVGAGWV